MDPPKSLQYSKYTSQSRLKIKMVDRLAKTELSIQRRNTPFNLITRQPERQTENARNPKSCN